jgi:hypothetical protein
MGRRKKNFEKKYEFDDFCVTTDIYKKQVVFFKMSFFGWKDNDNKEEQDIKEAKKEIKKALRNSFKDIKAERRIYDILMGEISKGKNISVKLFGGFRIDKTQEIEIIENEILEHSKELMEKIKKILYKLNFNKFTKPKRYERRI